MRRIKIGCLTSATKRACQCFAMFRNTIMASSSGLTSKLAIEETRRLIDQQKDDLYESIRQLNSRRNELASISVLPPELLGRIFSFVIEINTDAALVFLLSLGFTYVSQNWRNVALDTPSLWSTPVFLYPDSDWAKTMLERSKMADLVVSSNLSLNYSDLMKEIFNDHAARIREIDLHGLQAPLLSSIIENVQPSSLHLRSLRLSLENDWMGDGYDSQFPVFPSHLLVQPDILRRLVIVHCAFDLYAQPRPQLTHLKIVSPRDRPLLSEFATALSGMPALESLEMVRSLPLAAKAVKLDVKVELPKLSLLYMSSKENFFEVLNVIDFLIVPWTATIDLVNASQPFISDIVSPLRLFFSCMTGNIERRSYNRLRLCNSEYGLCLSAWRIEQPHSSTTDPADLVLMPKFDRHRSASSVEEILRCLPLFDLKTLLIDIGFGQPAIHSFFGQSTTIQTVELQSNAVVYDFLQVLTHKPEGYERSESSYYSVSFPALQSLIFNQTRFNAFGYLLDCLMERYERGAGLQTLSFYMCYDLSHENMQQLREIVPDVEWDEVLLTEELDYDCEDYGDYDDSSDEPEYDLDYM